MPDQIQPEQPSVAMLDKPWVRTLLWATLSGAISLAVSTAYATWTTRDYVESQREAVVKQIREDQLSHYVTKDDYYRSETERAEKLNAKLELIIDRIRATR